VDYPQRVAAPVRILTPHPAQAEKGEFEMVKITIKTDNAAFADYPGNEIIRILQTVIQNIKNGGCLELLHIQEELALRDINGNNVGSFIYDPREE
jgi:hypothetical protein